MTYDSQSLAFPPSFTREIIIMNSRPLNRRELLKRGAAGIAAGAAAGTGLQVTQQPAGRLPKSSPMGAFANRSWAGAFEITWMP